LFRILFLALLVGFSFELSGVAAVLGDPACEDCPNDRSGGECAPYCHACACCSVPRTVRSETTAVAPVAPRSTTEWVEEPSAPPTVDPRDILHVPRPLLA
jgi:hypothetical protein